MLDRDIDKIYSAVRWLCVSAVVFAIVSVVLVIISF